jgi:hypothetical protein
MFGVLQWHELDSELMRTFGRVPVPFPPSGVEYSQSTFYPAYKWVEVVPDANGDSDYVYITALLQCFRLNLGESPFWSNFGIPAKISIQTQQAPSYYISFIQTYFSQYFASLIIAQVPTSPNNTTPIYNVSIVRKNGSIFQQQIGL